LVVLDHLTRQLRSDKAVGAERHSQPHLTFGRTVDEDAGRQLHNMRQNDG
jgi:hypothetical protein